MIPITICIITKNEENRMEQFLKLIRKYTKGYSIELLVVDTGSTDHTKDISIKYADKVLDFTWIGDFSAARNYSLDEASNDWILVLDCDEFIEYLDMKQTQEYMEKYPTYLGLLTRRNHYITNGMDTTSHERVGRLFNKNYYRYQYPIHEQILPIDGSPIQGFEFPLLVDHPSYNVDPKSLKQKAERNIELLLKMLEEDPNQPYVYFHLGQCYYMINEDAIASEYFEKALEYDLDPSCDYVKLLIVSYGYTLLHTNRVEEALKLENLYNDFCLETTYLNLLGLIYMRNQYYLKAMAEFVKALELAKNNPLPDPSDIYIPCYNMGQINELLGNREGAIVHYKNCGDFPLALDRLKTLEQ